jgi:membrane protein implicated in regulation of membrane protease activity
MTGPARLPEREIGDAMEPEQESLTFAVVATGVLVLVAPTPLQVLWLLVLAGLLVMLTQRRGRGLDGPGDRGADGRSRERQP